jgi:hypothetical protein
MKSKAHSHMEICLKSICKSFNLPLLCEHKDGDKRYDFFIPTEPPVVVEVDGTQHFQDKADGFFFKSAESLQKYKQNDAERRLLNKLGKIRLYRFTTEEYPSITELLDIIDLDLLKKGVSLAYGKKTERNKEISERRKEQSRVAREKAKQSYNPGDRPIKGLPRFGNN